MHERRNKCLLTGNEFMLKMYLRQPGFNYAARYATKNNMRFLQWLINYFIKFFSDTSFF